VRTDVSLVGNPNHPNQIPPDTFHSEGATKLDNAFIRRAIKAVKFNTTVPVVLVCANPATPWLVSRSIYSYYLTLTIHTINQVSPTTGTSALGCSCMVLQEVC